MKNFTYILNALLIFLFCNCTEEIFFETETLESALVIEATITNELTTQEIRLSRTYAFDVDGPQPETGATVTLVMASGTLSFEEDVPGRYISSTPFAASSQEEYSLQIRTSNGRNYNSTPTQLTPTAQMEQLYTEREIIDGDSDGVSILVDSFDPTGAAQFYRFEYAETFKVISPKYSPIELFVIDPTFPTCSVGLRLKPEQKQICYGTNLSDKVIIASTSELNEDRLERFPVRQISIDDYIIRERYSILVKQFVQSQDAYNYQKTLQEFSTEGSIFSQSQPGFFSGNIISETNPDEKVVGYFEVSSVTSQRIFFNFEEVFDDADKPSFPSSCREFAPDRIGDFDCGSLISGIQLEQITYLTPNTPGSGVGYGPYIVVPRSCGDCTVFGENVIPDFWIE